MRFPVVQSKHSLPILLLFMVAFTASPSPGEDQMVKLFDVRNATDADKAGHYVVICARPAELALEEAKKLPVYSPGHVWVQVSR